MEKKGVQFSARQRAVLAGFRLRFNKKSLRERLPERVGFANIEPCEHAQVEGVLYNITPAALDALDVSEKSPAHYDRQLVHVLADSGKEDAWVYVANPGMTSDDLVPSRNYINHILAAESFLSRQYFEAIDQTNVYADKCECCGRDGDVLFVPDNGQLHVLCQSCREAQQKWGEAIQRPISVPETKCIMQELVLQGTGFASLEDLMQAAIAKGLIDEGSG